MTTLVALTGLLLTAVALRTGADAVRGVPLTPAEALLGVVAAAGATGVAWLGVGVALECLSRLPGSVGRLAERVAASVSPRMVRSAAAVLLGVGVGAGATGGAAGAAPVRAVSLAVPGAIGGGGPAPAAASGGPERARGTLPDPGWAATPGPAHGATPDPGWVPEPPRVRPQPEVSAVTAAARRTTGHDPAVVVRRGDSLWTIAARHLGSGATDSEVAAAWPRWYAANRAVIGEDPDLLRPGQRLHPPADTSP